MTRHRLPGSGHACRLSARAGAFCLSAVLFAGGVAAEPPGQQAGVSAAVKGTVARTSTLSSDDARERLKVGSRVYMQDRVDSAERSLAQLLLMDESTFKLGPDSSVVIDEFIYDPEAGTGEMVVEAASGVFRFISGAIGDSDPENVEINTPLGSLGVRGTIVTVKIRRDASGQPTEVLYLLNGPGADNNALAKRGAIQVTAQGVTVTVLRAGWGTIVRPGEPPTPPQPIPSDTLAALDEELASAPRPGARDDAKIKGWIRRLGLERMTGQSTANARARGEAMGERDALEAFFSDVTGAEDLNIVPLSGSRTQDGTTGGNGTPNFITLPQQPPSEPVEQPGGGEEPVFLE